MASKKFDTFPYGLDTRRSVLTSQPGTLAVLNNCHVNQGAEIEKRKAFVPLALLPGTFGLEAVANSLVVFGSQRMIGQTVARGRGHVGAQELGYLEYYSARSFDGLWTGYTPPVGAYFSAVGVGGTGYNVTNAVIVAALFNAATGTVGIQWNTTGSDEVYTTRNCG